jgi:Cd2+/Zn2+-exporting ATPase
VLFASTLLVASYWLSWVQPANRTVADLAALAGAVLLALPIFYNAARDLREGQVHMDELVALAVLAALAHGDPRSAGVIALLMLISSVIERQTAAGAHRAIEALVRLTPSVGRRLDPDGREVDVPAHELRPGERIRLRPGDVVPADARIVRGTTTLNEATITGESLPQDKGPGDEIFAGTVNLTGVIEAEVLRTGEDTTLGRVRALILEAEQTRLPFTRQMDRYAQYYTPMVVGLAALLWFFTDDWNRVVAVLVVACPCALILATPSAMVAALAAAARAGILVKNVADLEAVGQISAVVFDKTGTLTLGELSVVRLAPVGDLPPSRLLGLAASAERYSHHPAAVAMVRLAQATDVELFEPADVRDEAGMGVSARVGPDAVVCGRAEWLARCGVQVPTELAEPNGVGHLSTVHVAINGRYAGWIGLSDRLRPMAAEAVQQLHQQGVHWVGMITGDRATVARAIGAEAGCDEVRAECLPQAKAEYVHELRRRGHRVMVVGDGVNDVPALAAGDIGVALGAAGSDVALKTATVALMSDDLLRVPYLVRLSRASMRIVHQNLAMAGLFIGGGLYLSGSGELTPIAAAILHNLGSLMVIFNSGRLLRIMETFLRPTAPGSATRG